MLESLKIILEETWSVYKLGTLDGRLFLPFLICCIYLLLSPAEEDRRARNYFVYPSLILFVFLFNPVFIHYMIKFMLDPERVVRIFWPLPIGGVIVYCVIRGFYALKKGWKRAALLVASVFLLLLVTEGNHAGLSFARAQNPQKLIPGAKEVCDMIYALEDGGESRALVPPHLFFWIREYNAAILTPYKHKADFITDDDGQLDLKTTGEKAVAGACRYVVLPNVPAPESALADYGYALVTAIPGDNCTYYLYAAQS